MAETQSSEIASVLEEIRKQFAALSERVARIEQGLTPGAAKAAVTEAAAGGGAEAGGKEAAAAQEAAPTQPAGITEQELLAISAALAAYLGVRVHIRQIRLIGSRAWALEGRVSIQASHRL